MTHPRPMLSPILAALLLAVFAFASYAAAQTTPAGTAAGTQIQNQATADYIDSGGTARTVNSDLVITTVQQVYDVSVTPDGTVAAPGQTRDATPGATVYFPYTLTNNGNGTDTFELSSIVNTDDGRIDPVANSIFFYIDSNGDGVLQPGEDTSVTTITDLPATTANNANSVKLIMAYDIPASATAGQTVIATPVAISQGDDTTFDPVDTTTTPAPTRDAFDRDNYNQTTVVQGAALDASKSVNQTTIAPGGSLTYTITVTNTGSADATNVVITDTLPAGVTYTEGDATTSPDADNNATITIDDDDTAAPPTLTATFGTVADGQTVTFTIPVTVDSGTAPGPITNDAAVTSNSTTATVTTNTVTTTVQAAVDVAVGPNGAPSADNAAEITYITSDGYSVTSAANSDVQVVASANAGTTVSFINTIQNTGTATDTFNLTLNTDNLNLPAGATVQLLTASGTPLGDSNGDNIPDVANLDTGASRDFIVRVTIPATTPTETGTPDHSVVVTATSTADGTQNDTTTNTITDITGPGVLFGNADGVDTTVNDADVSQNANPDDTVVFPMDIINQGGDTDTFNLTGSAAFAGGNVPVVYYLDADNDGALDQAEIDAGAITSTGPVAAGAEVKVLAVIEVPADAAPQTANVTQSVTSPTSGVSDTAPVNTIVIGAINTFTFSPDRQGNVTSPGTVTYSHTLTNTGNETITSFGFAEAESGAGTDGFTYSYSFDGTTFYPVTDTANLTTTLAPGASTDFFVRVSAPAAVAINAVNTVTVTATATFGTGTATDSVTDTTTVVGGELSLTKTADVTTAAPGENITYTITATNGGSADLTQVVVSDPLPAFTDFVSVSATATGFGTAPQLLYSTDGTNYSATAPTALAAGQSIFVGVDSDSDNDVDEFDTFPDGATVTVTFVVQVQDGTPGVQ